MTAKKVKQKQCRVCGYRFIPRATTQIVCGPVCAITLNQRRKRKEFDAETKRLKKTIKTRKDYEKDAEKSFNAYVRIRDNAFPCISCGRYHTGRYDAGHWLSVGAFPELRFNLWNVHKQCHWNCNINRSGNQAAYRVRLVKKIGIDRVEWLEGPHKAKKYAIDDLIRIKNIFALKAKRLKANGTL